MTAYDETSMRKKFQVEVAVSYKDMGDQSSFISPIYKLDAN